MHEQRRAKRTLARANRALAGLLVLALILGFGLAAVGCSGSSDSSGSDSPGTLSGTGSFEGIPVGFTQQGYPYMGNADAPVTIEEFTDFLCPFCARHFSQTLPTLVRDYVAKGKVKYVFRDMPLASLHPTASQGHVAARCVAEQGAELFWAMHAELFTTQEKWRNLPDPTVYLGTAAEKAGADIGDYEKCLAAGAQKARVDESIATGTRKLKVDATPTFRLIQSAALAAKADPKSRGQKTYTLVGAYPLETFRSWLTALAAGKTPPAQPRPKEAAFPYWASAKGLAPDPARPGFTMAGDPYRGNPNAKVVVVEFSNFQCAACRRQAVDIQPTIDKTFVEPGKAMWVFKNLLLKEFPRSFAAAVAGECAGDQGRFWQMHDLLFARQAQWPASPPDPNLERLGNELRLDANRFASCLGSREASERVLNDVYDAENVTTTAPTFVVLVGGKGDVIRGAPLAREFVKLLQAQLDTANGAKQPRAEAPSSQAPASKAPGSLNALQRKPAKRTSIELGTTDLGVGRNRISFFVLDSESRAVERPTARVWLARRLDDPPEAEATARLEHLGVPGEPGVYVATLDVPQPGTYSLLAEPVGAPGVQALGTFHVRPKAAAPSVGDRAVAVLTPTVEGGIDPKTITTARPPDVELLRVSVAEALAAGRPFVVTFASPLFCRKRACGPVVDVVRSVAGRWRGRGIDFIHVEVYEDNDVQRGYNEWMRAWDLPSDPFTYVVDGRGVIRTKLEGAFSPGELDAAVKAVAPGR
jgi:protein-disulfide isomerase